MKQLLGRAAQLDLELDRLPRPATARSDPAAELLDRLRALGMSRIHRCCLTRNRHVMVSFGSGALRVHEGYLTAPLEVLRAIVVFVEGRTRAERLTAQRIIIAHPVSTSPSMRRPRTRPEDRSLVAELARWHERYNTDHFHGRLETVSLRVSRRMRSRLGHYTCAAHGVPAEIALSWRHIRRDGWEEARHTLLHEMVHQWQDETGQEIDHGPEFRAKAREVGVAPFARRTLKRGSQRPPSEGRIGRSAARDR
ncbi:MAG TPA: SprT-like domain-containing protein [Gemmatimonadaceae bacterium]